VEVGARQEVDQLVPRTLHRPRPDADPLRNRIRQIHFESDQPIRLGGILEDLRRAALWVGTPLNLFLRYALSHHSSQRSPVLGTGTEPDHTAHHHRLKSGVPRWSDPPV